MSRDASSISWSRAEAAGVAPCGRRGLLAQDAPVQAARATARGAPSRRGLLGALGLPLGLLGLGGCGFRPLYAPVTAADGSESDLREELAAVRVANIPDRSGQLLRRTLQRRFEGSAPGTPARYNLQVAISYAFEVLGYRRDGTPTRIRTIASGNWVLTTLTVPPQQIAATAIPYRTLDSFNIPDLQFFAADTARDAMEQRLVDELAEEIHRRVALELRGRREARTT
jgi:LPS-assembly lipoprotein